MIYIYNKNTDDKAVGSLQSKDILACGDLPNTENSLFLKVKGKDGSKKEIVIKVDSFESKCLWITSINDSIKQPDINLMPDLTEDDTDLFKDELPLFAEIELLPSLEY
mmetsp:Transcript_35338/g.31796  ORF Transcript_35338/g.31796 Transcript_35338/m.31796 type:complete len:108 (+) Transcript_35338:2488-2811(+)